MALRVIINKLPLPDTNMTAKVFITEGDRLLLLLRKKDQAHPKKWDLPGGHLVIGETWIDGAIRETLEETNLRVSDLSLLKSSGRHRFYTVGSWSGEIYPSDQLPEHDDWKWFTKGELEALTNISDNYKEMAIEVLSK